MLESSTNFESRLRTLTSEAHSLETSVIQKKAQRQSWQEVRSRAEDKIRELEMNRDNLKMIEAYLANFSKERQAAVYRQLEETVSEGLTSVFGKEMRLGVTDKMVGSRAETVFTITTAEEEGTLETPIMDFRGGGIAAVVGALVEAVLVLLTPNMRPIIFSDEGFRNVSLQYQEPLGEFLSDLCKRTGLQYVLVTHQPEIAAFADKQYEVTKRDGKTNIKEI